MREGLTVVLCGIRYRPLTPIRCAECASRPPSFHREGAEKRRICGKGVDCELHFGERGAGCVDGMQLCPSLRSPSCAAHSLFPVPPLPFWRVPSPPPSPSRGGPLSLCPLAPALPVLHIRSPTPSSRGCPGPSACGAPPRPPLLLWPPSPPFFSPPHPSVLPSTSLLPRPCEAVPPESGTFCDPQKSAPPPPVPTGGCGECDVPW